MKTNCRKTVIKYLPHYYSVTIIVFLLSYHPMMTIGACQVTISGSNSICLGGATTLTANPTGGVGTYNYSWALSLVGPGFAFTPSITVNPSSTTKYYIRIADSNTPPCQIVDSITVIVYPLPIARFSFSPTNSPCATETIYFTNTSTGGILPYSWNFGDIASGSSNTSPLFQPNHLFEAYGYNTPQI